MLTLKSLCEIQLSLLHCGTKCRVETVHMHSAASHRILTVQLTST